MMVRSLWTGATGMKAMQTNIDVIANDLTNINTVGYKKRVVNFQDLLYQTMRAAGLQGGNGVNLPVGVQVGLGVRVGGTTPVMTVGPFNETGNWYDMAIEENLATGIRNFFRVDTGNGYAYTRDGSFRLDSEGRLVTINGYFLDPQPGPIAANAVSWQITPEGSVQQMLPNATAFEEVGVINLFTFVNPAGLDPLGGNLWRETAASGESTGGQPGAAGFGRIRSNFVEQSNVDAISEMVNMIAAQRAYEFNSKSITTSDEMLSTVNQLKR